MKKNVGFHFFKVWERRANFEMLKVVKEMEEVKDTLKTENPSCENTFAMEKSNPKSQAEYWVAALVQMNTEKKASAALTKLGFRNYLPTQTVIRQWSDRKKKIERIVIPMIIFVLVDKQSEINLRKTSHIYKLISYPGEKEAAIIPDEQIENLKFMLNNADSAVEFSDKPLQIGEEIEIVRGPLKGLCGELCYTEVGKPMLGVHIKLLGYSYVNVDVKDVKRK